jgi:hypothetical protein
VAADLWGDLLGAEAHLAAADRQFLSPLPLWTGIVAGPIAWALDLASSYALVKPVCRTQHTGMLSLFIPLVCLALIAAGVALSWMALRRTEGDVPLDGGRPRQRARFMAVLGLSSSALFALQILAATIPPRVLDACQ